MAPAEQDIRVQVLLLATRPKAATVGVGRQVILRPAVQKRYVELDEPTLSDQRSDHQRLWDALDDLELRTDLHVMRRLSKVLRAADFKVTAVIVDDVLIDVEPGDTTARRFGIAYDLGTTTVVATLLDLSTGTPVAVGSMLNPQQPFGADVITRISATMMDPQALEQLATLARQCLHQLATEICADGGVELTEVYEVALAGNATMTHIALGIDPESLGVAPFVMTSRIFDAVLAGDIGVGVHSGARAYLFPSLGAYVGGDIVSGTFGLRHGPGQAHPAVHRRGHKLRDRAVTRRPIARHRGPGGPGLRRRRYPLWDAGRAGAIEGVKISDEDVCLQVIGDVEPVGLCGSGLVDAVAALVQANLLDASGRLLDAETAAQTRPELAERLRKVGDERVFVLHWPGPRGDMTRAIYLSQRDVRELQFAKAAIATGWQLLIEQLGLAAADIQQVLLAGSFGSFLAPASAVRIGLVPDIPTLRIVSAGNVAGEGAKMALLSIRERAAARGLLEQVHYVELSDRPDFNDRFVDQLAFPV